MQKRISNLLAVLGLVVIVASLGSLWIHGQTTGPNSGNQALARMRTVSDGVQQGGANVLQSAPAYTVSAAVASATLTKVVTHGTLPAYVGRLWVEKAAGTTGAVDLKYGTGTNCGTGTTTILSLAANAANPIPLGQYEIGAIVPVLNDVCLDTEGANTSARVLSN